MTTVTTTGSISHNPDFPCAIQINVPFPTPRLASTALQALGVDPELSPLVQRHLSVVSASPSSSTSTTTTNDTQAATATPAASTGENNLTILQVEYRATTNRMLRVAVNSFMESLKLVVEVMEQLDVDVLQAVESQAAALPIKAT